MIGLSPLAVSFPPYVSLSHRKKSTMVLIFIGISNSIFLILILLFLSIFFLLRFFLFN